MLSLFSRTEALPQNQCAHLDEYRNTAASGCAEWHHNLRISYARDLPDATALRY